jgi:predicted peptidase
VLISGVVWQRLELCGLPTLTWSDSLPDAPMVVFLHGIGERGDDGVGALRFGLPDVVAKAPVGLRVFVPQCPVTRRWIDCMDDLRLLFDGIEALSPERPARIALTGFSMGGTGVVAFAARHPERVSRIAPVAARLPADIGTTEIATALRSVPTWVFHGVADRQVPVKNSDTLVAELRAHGGAPGYTRYKAADHSGSCALAYGDPELHKGLAG